MNEAFQVADILLDRVKAHFADDIAIVAYYGSQARGTARPDSDIDVFFIPATDRGWTAGLTFTLNGVGYDFWPIGWDRAERIASFDEPIVSVIADSKLLYWRSEDDLERFEQLKERIRSFSHPSHRQGAVSKATDAFEKCFVHLYNLNLTSTQTDLTSARIEAFKLLCHLMHALALLNQTYFPTGWGQSVPELVDLQLKPDDLEALLDQAIRSTDPARIRRACEQLVANTRELLLTVQKEAADPQLYSDVFPEVYEEMKSSLNKIKAACRERDYPTAFFRSLGVQVELHRLLSQAETGMVPPTICTYSESPTHLKDEDLPDLARALAPDQLDELEDGVDRLDRRFRELLDRKGVKVRDFDSLDDLRSFVKHPKEKDDE